MLKKIAFEHIPFIPFIVAETVANQPYTGMEYSENARNPVYVQKYENLRQKMTKKQIEAFAEWVDRRCRYCYENNVEWFMKLANAKTSQGRDQLYVWVSHWLAAYLNNPEIIHIHSMYDTNPYDQSEN